MRDKGATDDREGQGSEAAGPPAWETACLSALTRVHDGQRGWRAVGRGRPRRGGRGRSVALPGPPMGRHTEEPLGVSQDQLLPPRPQCGAGGGVREEL